MNFFREEVRADYFHVHEGTYFFYNKNEDAHRDEDVLICAYPVGLTIIESIEDNEDNIMI